jgi:putative endonuclease
MLDKDGTLVFVEVRQRSGQQHGGAAASVSHGKQRRCILAAKHYLLAWMAQGKPLPPCRFDVVALDGPEMHWLPGAFMDTP